MRSMKGRRRRRRSCSRSRSPRRSRSREVVAARPPSPALVGTTALLAQQPQPQAVPDWLSDLFSAEPQPQPQASAATTLEIPLHLVPLITPMVLAGIRAASGAEVALREDMQHYGYSLAIITGTPQAVALAKIMMQQNLGLAGESSNIVREVEVTGDPMVPIGAVELAQAELRLKASGVPMSILPPQGPMIRDKLSLVLGLLPMSMSRRHLSEKNLQTWSGSCAGGRAVLCHWNSKFQCNASTSGMRGAALLQTNVSIATPLRKLRWSAEFLPRRSEGPQVASIGPDHL